MNLGIDKSCALIRAANLRLMDYPFEASLQSALAICDEAVVVVGQSQDDTVEWVNELAKRFSRVTIVHSLFKYDLMWQERWWDLAQANTDAEWLLYWDADEVIHEKDVTRIRAMMARPEIRLISLPFIHFYMTLNWERNFAPRATRLGRRSAGYRMRNWRGPNRKDAPACMMVFDEQGIELGAHNVKRDGMGILQTPIYHYSWCRTPQARSYSNHKMRDWYADGQLYGLTDGVIPDVDPHNYLDEIVPLLKEEQVYPSTVTEHPAAMKDWISRHEAGWRGLEQALEQDSRGEEYDLDCLYYQA